MRRPVITALSGSLRQNSANTAILQSLRDLVEEIAEVRLFPLGDLPLYNADIDGEHPPLAVQALRAAVSEADGLVIATPEYNYGMTGVLKNALDWASRPGYKSVLKDKPVLVMSSSTGSTGGVRAQAQIRQTLAATLSRVVLRPEVYFPHVASKIAGGKLVDQPSANAAVAALEDLILLIASTSGSGAAGDGL